MRHRLRSTLSSSSAASDVYKRQKLEWLAAGLDQGQGPGEIGSVEASEQVSVEAEEALEDQQRFHVGSAVRRRRRHYEGHELAAVSYTHLRAHETVLDLVCRLLLEIKNPYYDKIS
eukprot:TRINITY_DN55190_c0_g1_i1.p2 TRINITY_DN55190_c0_g1~~TRINITY_DN55190_c0_g1_i1.p2  ORF type:complete len:116 (-),score=18.89 TRINITY_DN55190_c0_g1_i1:25-372(-)